MMVWNQPSYFSLNLPFISYRYYQMIRGLFDYIIIMVWISYVPSLMQAAHQLYRIIRMIQT